MINNKLNTYFTFSFLIFFISCQGLGKQEKVEELTWAETPGVEIARYETDQEDCEEDAHLTTKDDTTINHEEEGDPPAELELPAYSVLGSWTIQGTIGPHRVDGTITFTQDGFHGQYGYNGKKTGITLRGNSVDENDGHLFAQEFNNKGEQCGEYHGIFIYPRTCKGVFTSYKGEAFDFEWHFE